MRIQNHNFLNNGSRMAAALLLSILIFLSAAACGLPTGTGDVLGGGAGSGNDGTQSGTSTPPAVLDVSFSDQIGGDTNSFADPITEAPIYFDEIYCYASDADSVSIQFGDSNGLMEDVFELSYDSEDLRWEYIVQEEDSIPVVLADGLFIECTATAGDPEESDTLRLTLSDLPPIIRSMNFKPKQNTLNFLSCDVRFADTVQVRVYELLRDFAMSPSTVSEIDETFDLTYNSDTNLWEWEPTGGETLPNMADEAGTGGIDDDDLDIECIATSSKGTQTEYYEVTD